jgi:hypothetical protein
MKAAAGMPIQWVDLNLLPQSRRSPTVVVLAGVDASPIVEAALTDTAIAEAVVLRFEPACSAPCDALLWRLETADGESLNHKGLLRRHWHRRPYAVTVRLVQYLPGSATPDILDEGTVGTRGSRFAFHAALDRLAMRFVRDAARGRARGPAATPPAARPSGPPGWLNRFHAVWHSRLMTEWWSLGSTRLPIRHLLEGGALDNVHWYAPKPGHSYLADPSPWPGTDSILCEQAGLTHGIGSAVAVSHANATLSSPTEILAGQNHHSYPSTFRDQTGVYCVPETIMRGETRIHRLREDGSLLPIGTVAQHARLADPTLFYRNGRYWLGCTDLDLGDHDNLCLLHADTLAGPWLRHARWPVKIDVRGARSAGPLIEAGNRLFRPAQDCAATYGAAVALHEVTTLTPTDFSETLVSVLRPDRAGPFPHGLHTLAHDGERFWLDGKRFVFHLPVLRHKLARFCFNVIARVVAG